jgi:RND family efflux transporter MFP subunit
MKLEYMPRHFLLFIISLILVSNTVLAEEFEATLDWSKRVELSTQVNGLVQKVYAQAGSIVAKGEVLVQLDPRAFKADLEYAKAKLKNTKEQSKEAKRELDRQADMYDRSMLSERDLQIAKNNLTAARSIYYQAQSALTKAKLNLEYSAIRAPFNAVVIRTLAVKGQVVASQMNPPTLVIVAEAKKMLARFYASTSLVNTLLANQAIQVNIAGNNFQGKVFSIGLEPNKLKPGYYAVDVIFDSKEIVLRAGQRATINL